MTERDLRKLADEAWGRGSKDLSQDLHQAAREEEQRKRDMSRYLEDHLIQNHLSRIDQVVTRYRIARMEKDYGSISFALGELSGLAGLVYTRNAQIDAEGTSWE